LGAVFKTKPMLRDRKIIPGQGDRGGGGPAGHAAKGNPGPAWIPAHPQGLNSASGYFEDRSRLLSISLMKHSCNKCLKWVAKINILA
jgi:hypothetical protein